MTVKSIENMRIFNRFHPAVIISLFFILIFASCTQEGSQTQGEIPVGDIIVVWPGSYDGVTSDIMSDDRIHNSIARICRSLDEFIELCPAAGIEYGADIPSYSEAWFNDNSVIVLAFYHGSWSYRNGGLGPGIGVGKVSVDERTVQVDLQYKYDNINFDATPYGIIIEVEAKLLVNTETVVLNGL